MRRAGERGAVYNWQGRLVPPPYSPGQREGDRAPVGVATAGMCMLYRTDAGFPFGYLYAADMVQPPPPVANQFNFVQA